MSKQTFEESLEQLESIVKKLEAGDVLLDEAMEYFKKGMQLSKFCHDKLKTAEENVNHILSENGELIKMDVKKTNKN